jgi:hypothetical protein
VTNPSTDPLIIAYSQQEVQLMGSLSHPNIVQFEEAFELPDQSWVIVMEYCEGRAGCATPSKSLLAPPPHLHSSCAPNKDSKY